MFDKSIFDEVPLIGFPADDSALEYITGKYPNRYVLISLPECRTCHRVIDELYTQNINGLASYQKEAGIAGFAIQIPDNRYRGYCIENKLDGFFPKLQIFKDNELMYYDHTSSTIDIKDKIQSIFKKPFIDRFWSIFT